MNNLIIATAISGYIWFTYSLLKYKDSFAISSFILWLVMDTIMIINTFRAGTDLKLIGTYTVGTLLFLILLLFKQKFEWNKKTDTPIAFLAILLVITSCLTKATIGVFAGATALFIAGVPNMIKTLQVKRPTPRMLYTGFSFFLGPLLSCICFYKNNARFEEYVYPVLSLVYWSIILVNLFLKQKTLRE